MKYKSFCMIICLSIFMTGCFFDKKINAESQETYKESIDKISKSLNENEREKFLNALSVVALYELGDFINKKGLFGIRQLYEIGNSINKKGVLEANPSGSENLINEFIKKLDGKNAQEVIQMAETIELKHRQDKLKSIKAEIIVLKQKKIEAEKSKSVLDSIKISNPKFYWEKDYFRDEAVISFTIENQTNVPLSFVAFHGVLMSPNRSIPWVSEGFSYKFKGGIEPKEILELDLLPNMFGEWASPETQGRNDLILTINVVNAKNAKNEDIAVTFDEEDAKRLLTLEEMKTKL